MKKHILGRAFGGRFIGLALAVGGTFVGGSVQAGTYYVSTVGSDTAAGTNWTTAVKTLPVGVAKTTPAGGGTVVVSNGTYTLTSTLVVSNVTVVSLSGYTNTFVRSTFRTHSPQFVLRGGAVIDGFTMREYDGAAGVGVATIENGTLQNCYIRGGTGTGTIGGGFDGYYGAVELNGVNARARNCVITKHRGRFSVVYISTNGGTMDNCTIYSNTVYELGYDLPGGNWYSAGVSFRTVNSAVRNCILYNNVHTNGTTLNYSRNVNASYALDYSCTTPIPVGGDGIVTNPPAFVNAATGDFRLLADSPCVNWGDNLAWAILPTAVDLDGKPRKSGVRVDMGAYEFQFPLETLISIR